MAATQTVSDKQVVVPPLPDSTHLKEAMGGASQAVADTRDRRNGIGADAKVHNAAQILQRQLGLGHCDKQGGLGENTAGTPKRHPQRPS